MTDRSDGPWDAPTEHDDQHDVESADLSGEDPPTMRASDSQRAKARGAAIANQLATASAHGVAKATTLAPPPARQPAMPSTTRPPHEPAMPATTRPLHEPAKPPATQRTTATYPPTAKPAATQPPTAKPAIAIAPSEDFVVLDRVSGNMRVGHAPLRSESAAGGIVVVATGEDADRVRKLCHRHGLLVPVMTSLAVVHDAMSVVVIGEPSPPAAERVVHVVRPTLPDGNLLDLLRALVTGHVIVEPPQARDANDPRAAEAARRLATLTDRAAIEIATVDAITALTAPDRAHCTFHDPATGALWSEARRRVGGDDDRTSMCGLVGWAAQTGQRIHASPAGDDPRWVQELDDPDGKAQSRLLVQPIIGADRRVHAVLVVARRWRHSDFSDAEVRALAAFAAAAGPALDLAVAAPPAEPRKRITAPSPTAAASRSALVAAPRTPSDSRPPPVTTQPPRPRSRTEEERTKVEDRASGARRVDDDRAAGVRDDHAGPAEPTRVEADRAAASRTKLEGHDAAARAKRDSSDDDDDDGPPERYSESSITALPSPPRPPERLSTNPVPALEGNRPSTGPARVVDKRTGPIRSRNAPDSSQPLARREGEQRDVAVIANEEDARRAQRLAKKHRIELSTFPKIGDAPDFYVVVTLGETWAGEDPRVAYAARSTIPDDQLGDLLVGLAYERVVAPAAPLSRPQSAAEARRSQLAFLAARKLAASANLAAAEALVSAALRELLDSDRAYLWFVEPSTGALWSEARKGAIDPGGGSEFHPLHFRPSVEASGSAPGAGHNRRAIAGIAGWVARTGRPASVPRGSADPRWLGPIDDPEGDPHSQLLVQPIVRGDERVHGVLIAARRARRPGFTETDAALFARFAALVAPQLEQIEIGAETQQMIDDDTATRKQLPDAPDSSLLAILRGAHPLARWLYLVLGVIVGLVIGLLV